MRRNLLAQALILTVITTTMTGCSPFKRWWDRHILRKTTVNQPGSLGGTDIGTADGGTGSRPVSLDGATRGEFVPVYFDYDSAAIKPSEHGKLEAVAASLKGNSKKLVIEGHTDERGTAEYNRNLGEKRAQAALKSLASLGIASSRMTTISYGKDRPAEMGHDDTAFSRNRRCEFVVVSQ